MAKFFNQPRLEITVDTELNRATASVRGIIEFDELERSLMEQEPGLEISVKAALFGDDSRNDDDLNLVTLPVTFTGTQPARGTYELFKGMPGSALNEDVPGKDEIFAFVTATNNLGNAVVADRKSNVIEFFFRND